MIRRSLLRRVPMGKSAHLCVYVRLCSWLRTAARLSQTIHEAMLQQQQPHAGGESRVCPEGKYQQPQRISGSKTRAFALPQTSKSVMVQAERSAGIVLEGYSEKNIMLKLKGKSIVLCSAFHSIKIQQRRNLAGSVTGAKGRGVSLPTSLSCLHYAA